MPKMINTTETNTTSTAYSDGVGFLDGGKIQNIPATWSNLKQSILRAWLHKRTNSSSAGVAGRVGRGHGAVTIGSTAGVSMAILRRNLNLSRSRRCWPSAEHEIPTATDLPCQRRIGLVATTDLTGNTAVGWRGGW